MFGINDKPQRGRPRATRATKDYVFQLRLTADQRARIERAATNAGEDMAPFVRRLIFKGLNDQEQ